MLRYAHSFIHVTYNRVKHRFAVCFAGTLRKPDKPDGFLPFDALIGVKLIDNLQISLEVGVPIIKDYPVYNFKTDAQIMVSF